MDAATVARIFEPFFTTRPDGNGLGLATVREIVREHGGAMNVQSAAGEGSRFEVWLPCETTAEPVAEIDASTLPLGCGETVLIVANANARLLRDEEMLAALGYEPVGFSSAEAALTACRAAPERFDTLVVGYLGSVTASLELAAALHAAAPRRADRAGFEIDRGSWRRYAGGSRCHRRGALADRCFADRRSPSS